MRVKTTHVFCNSQDPESRDIPLYAIFQDGVWSFVDEEIWSDLVLQGDEYAFTCEHCKKPLADCECGS